MVLDLIMPLRLRLHRLQIGTELTSGTQTLATSCRSQKAVRKKQTK